MNVLSSHVLATVAALRLLTTAVHAWTLLRWDSGGRGRLWLSSAAQPAE